MSAADRLRVLLERPGLLTMPGCHDAASARLIEEAGFEGMTLLDSFDTATGRIDIIRAEKPGLPGPAQ